MMDSYRAVLFGGNDGAGACFDHLYELDIKKMVNRNPLNYMLSL